MAKRKKIKLSDKAYELLKKDIVECFLEPGEIIEEAVVCARHKIGHTPFREATARLNAEGWIEISPHRGYFASTISSTQIRDLFELRLMIEPRATYLACLKINSEGLALLEKNVEESRQLAKVNDVPKSLRNSIEFHRLIAQWSGNRELADLVENLHFKLVRAIVYVLKESPPPRPLNFHHQEILKAFKNKDPSLAQSEMEKDLQDTIKMLDLLRSGSQAA
jgi:DNA-binding GntR family transcriptional regulator